ncbi:MAG: 4'-phosphopantetheinyl transferase superfamily protein [Mucilaginibacter sp.]|uniref:4'-phosphopantetheinyl transferase family protein n=1 Tax=Mucilaginibacter sp. TaxID=1882438 RepID=UPI0032631CD9
MISIGNDIVALGAINRQRSNDTRFHSKFITPTELALYQQPAIAAMPFESFVWLLWSVKEAAYKYQKRLEPDLIFSPAKIVVQHIIIPATYPNKVIEDAWEIDVLGVDFIHGEVHINTGKLYFKSIINADLIATVVDQEPAFQNIYWGIQKIVHTDSENQSRLVRVFLLNKFQSVFPQGNLTLQKSAVGYPVLFNNGVETGILISLAHHGHFTSYCFNMAHQVLI